MALSIQERIKDLRLDRGLTLKQLAEQDCSLSAYKVFKPLMADICSIFVSKKNMCHKGQ